MSRYVAHDQSRYPLATLVLCACERAPAQRTRLLAAARRESDARAVRSLYPIPPIDG